MDTIWHDVKFYDDLQGKCVQFFLVFSMQIITNVIMTNTSIMIVFTCTSGLLDPCPRSCLPPSTLSTYPGHHTLSFSTYPGHHTLSFLTYPGHHTLSFEWWRVWYSHFCFCVCAGHFFSGNYWKDQSILLYRDCNWKMFGKFSSGKVSTNSFHVMTSDWHQIDVRIFWLIFVGFNKKKQEFER